MVAMNTLKARVVNGRLVLDEPCTLPEGTVLELVVADDGDELDDVERRALHAALEESWESAKKGELKDADEVMRELRKRG
jgi:hypothetical protein